MNWTQYKLLLSISYHDKREFYLAESCKNNWSSRQLERQINSSLYGRLLLSNDKESVLAVARNEQQPLVLMVLPHFRFKYHSCECNKLNKTLNLLFCYPFSNVEI
ncbi:DUF1016 N-terminal domain-containing protein [Mannheimia pernigra]|uniref:DUF1016 N-terminal domain-containing protein n=1 Tax=Mannheimia pernigra TaxID=111844 RepID=UPI003EB7D225